MTFFVRCVLLLSLVVPGVVRAETVSTDANTRNEISALLKALGASQCEFFRNGTWYDSAKAQEHLERKLDYFERKKLLSTAEAFVDQAASRSSMSGKAYEVRCAGESAQPSADWLKQKLEGLRKRGTDPAR